MQKKIALSSAIKTKTTGQTSGLTLDHLIHLNGGINAMEKVQNFLVNNPLCQTFIKKEKGRLPYSVFKPHCEKVFFLKSVYDKRPPTAFFPYPKDTKKHRDNQERLR